MVQIYRGAGCILGVDNRYRETAETADEALALRSNGIQSEFPLKQLLPSLALRIRRIPNLEPILAVAPVLQVGDDAFQVALASPPEELDAVAFDVIRIEQHGRLVGDDRTEQALALDKRLATEI